MLPYQLHTCSQLLLPELEELLELEDDELDELELLELELLEFELLELELEEELELLDEELEDELEDELPVPPLQSPAATPTPVILRSSIFARPELVVASRRTRLFPAER